LALNDTEMLVVYAMAMRLNEEESLAWLASHGVLIKRAQLYRTKARLRSLKDTKSDTAPSKFLENNANMWIEQLDTILYLSYQNASKEKDPLKNQKILESIVGMLPTVSAYSEASTIFKKDASSVNKYSDGVISYFENLNQR